MRYRKFTSRDAGYSGIVPEGWVEIESGQFKRRASDTDPTFLVELGIPGAAIDLVVSMLLPKIGLETLPPSTGRFENEKLGWDLYATERQDSDVGSMKIDLAFAQDDTGVYVVLFGTTLDEYNAQHYAVFMRTVDALSPLVATEAPHREKTRGTTGDIQAEVVLVKGEKLENEASECVAELLQTELGLSTTFVDWDALDQVDFQGVKLIYFPGGEAASIHPSDKALRHVRQAVAAGMGYIGICAGAFIAAEAVTTASHMRLGSNSYTFGIFPGLAEWGGGEGIWPFYIDTHHPLVARSSVADKIASVMHMRFVGGTSNLTPSYAEAMQHWQVASLDRPINGGLTGKRPAMTTTVFGKGRVFLSGPHPEAQEDTHALLLAAIEWCTGKSDPESSPLPHIAAHIPEEGTVNRFVQCSAAGSLDPQGLPVGFTWDFGDGSPKQYRPEAIHIYEKPGTYTISLTVSAGTRHSTDSRSISIRTT